MVGTALQLSSPFFALDPSLEAPSLGDETEFRCAFGSSEEDVASFSIVLKVKESSNVAAV
jgi:hypothetical protein